MASGVDGLGEGFEMGHGLGGGCEMMDGWGRRGCCEIKWGCCEIRWGSLWRWLVGKVGTEIESGQ